MIREHISKALFSASVLVAVAVTATPVQAQKPIAPNAPAGSGYPQFSNQLDAVKQCGNDKVVWGSGANKGVLIICPALARITALAPMAR